MLKNVIDQEMETKLAELEAVSEITVNGETSIDDEVIAAIAGVACREVDGITSLGTTSIQKMSANCSAWPTNAPGA